MMDRPGLRVAEGVGTGDVVVFTYSVYSNSFAVTAIVVVIATTDVIGSVSSTKLPLLTTSK